MSRAEIEAGLWAPVEQYALIESALGAAEHHPDDAHRREISELWARFNEVARTNPEAAFPQPLTADELATFGAHNRPLAFPVRQVARQSVDSRSRRGPVVVLRRGGRTPWSTPRPLGLPIGRIWSRARRDPLTTRASCTVGPRWRCSDKPPASTWTPLSEPATTPRCTRAFRSRCGCSSASSVCRSTRTPTITGGMAFAGGPFNSFVLQATAAMAQRVRERAGLGLVTTVSGLLTKPGLAVWSSEPGDQPPLVADLGAEAEAVTETVVGAEWVPGPRHDRGLDRHLRGSRAQIELIAVIDTPRWPAVDRCAATTPSSSASGTRSALVGVPVGWPNRGSSEPRTPRRAGAPDSGARRRRRPRRVRRGRRAAPLGAGPADGVDRHVSRPRGDSRPVHPRRRSRRRAPGPPRARRPWPPPPPG